jgi:hypothetical protein
VAQGVSPEFKPQYYKKKKKERKKKCPSGPPTPDSKFWVATPTQSISCLSAREAGKVDILYSLLLC